MQACGGEGSRLRACSTNCFSDKTPFFPFIRISILHVLKVNCKKKKHFHVVGECCHSCWWWLQGCTNRCSLAAGLRRNGERMRKWREIHSQDFLILCLFPPSLSISYIKNCHILSQNVKYGTFVANVTKNLTYALWENNSGSNSLRESTASCEGLIISKLI